MFAGINFREFFYGHFPGIYFRKLGFTEDFAGINFREFSLTKDFSEINFHEDFTGVDLTFASTIVYGFENNLSKN